MVLQKNTVLKYGNDVSLGVLILNRYVLQLSYFLGVWLALGVNVNNPPESLNFGFDLSLLAVRTLFPGRYLTRSYLGLTS